MYYMYTVLSSVLILFPQITLFLLFTLVMSIFFSCLFLVLPGKLYSCMYSLSVSRTSVHTMHLRLIVYCHTQLHMQP